jgi:hypothetical protein
MGHVFSCRFDLTGIHEQNSTYQNQGLNLITIDTEDNKLAGILRQGNDPIYLRKGVPLDELTI